MWDPFSSLSLCCHFYACLLEWYLLNHPTWNISTISNYQTDMPVNQTSNQDLSEIFLSINSNHRNVIFFASFQPSGNSLKKNTTSSLSVIKPNFWLMLLRENLPLLYMKVWKWYTSGWSMLRHQIPTRRIPPEKNPGPEGAWPPSGEVPTSDLGSIKSQGYGYLKHIRKSSYIESFGIEDFLGYSGILAVLSPKKKVTQFRFWNPW